MVAIDVFGTVIMVACNFMVRETYWQMNNDLRYEKQQNIMLTSKLQKTENDYGIRGDQLFISNNISGLNNVETANNITGQSSTQSSAKPKNPTSPKPILELDVLNKQLQKCSNQTEQLEAIIRQLKIEIAEHEAVSAKVHSSTLNSILTSLNPVTIIPTDTSTPSDVKQFSVSLQPAIKDTMDTVSTQSHSPLEDPEVGTRSNQTDNDTKPIHCVEDSSLACNCSSLEEIVLENELLSENVSSYVNRTSGLQRKIDALTYEIEDHVMAQTQLTQAVDTSISELNKCMTKKSQQNTRLKSCLTELGDSNSQKNVLADQYARLKKEFLILFNKDQECLLNGEKHDSGCLTIHQVSLAWPEARDVCQTLNGTLVQTISANDQTVGAALLRHWSRTTTGGAKLWIGATDTTKEGVWRWQNGQPLKDENGHQLVVKNARHRDCLAVIKSRSNHIVFQALKCSSKLGFMCSM